MFRYEPLMTAGSMLKIVSEKKAGIAMNSSTVKELWVIECLLLIEINLCFTIVKFAVDENKK